MRVSVIALSCLVVLGIVAGLRGGEARACSCLARAPVAYFKAADAVFIGVADVKGDAVTLQVLHVLKGEPGPRVVLSDAGHAPSGCAAGYRTGEVAIVFLRAGQASVCDGNYAMDYTLGMPGLADLFRVSKPELPTVATLRRALEVTLTPYLGGRADIAVRTDLHGGQAFTIGATRFVTRGTREPGVRPDDVHITDWVSAAGATFVAGELPSEGVRFAVLLGGETGQGPLVYGQRLVETKVATPYACAVDADCTQTCAAGAVNAAWLAETRERLTDCHDGCTSKGTDPPRCQGGICTAYFRGAVSQACTRRPVPWRP